MRVLPPLPVAVAGMAVLGLMATTAPLLTYSLTLALFGGAHVLSELRYVEARFAARIERHLLAGMGVFLAGVVGLRLMGALGLWKGPQAMQVELALVAGLGALVLPTLSSAGLVPLLAGLVVVGLVGAGLVLAPVWTMLALACLHNWTPVGFLAEGLPATERRQGWLIGGLAFGVGPLLVFLGAIGALPAWPDFSLLSVGSLGDHLGAYLPRDLHDASWATAAFSALVFAQCMHYGAVIGVLPRIAPGGADAPAAVGLSRIPARTWVVAITVLSGLGFVGYALDFTQARAWYGLMAAVHAWVEIPILLVAFLPTSASAPR